MNSFTSSNTPKAPASSRGLMSHTPSKSWIDLVRQTVVENNLFLKSINAFKARLDSYQQSFHAFMASIRAENTARISQISSSHVPPSSQPSRPPPSSQISHPPTPHRVVRLSRSRPGPLPASHPLSPPSTSAPPPPASQTTTNCGPSCDRVRLWLGSKWCPHQVPPEKVRNGHRVVKISIGRRPTNKPPQQPPRPRPRQPSPLPASRKPTPSPDFLPIQTFRESPDPYNWTWSSWDSTPSDIVVSERPETSALDKYNQIRADLDPAFREKLDAILNMNPEPVRDLELDYSVTCDTYSLAGSSAAQTDEGSTVEQAVSAAKAPVQETDDDEDWMAPLKSTPVLKYGCLPLMQPVTLQSHDSFLRDLTPLDLNAPASPQIEIPEPVTFMENDSFLRDLSTLDLQATPRPAVQEIPEQVNLMDHDSFLRDITPLNLEDPASPEIKGPEPVTLAEHDSFLRTLSPLQLDPPFPEPLPPLNLRPFESMR